MDKAKCVVITFFEAQAGRSDEILDLAPPEIEVVVMDGEASSEEKLAACRDADFLIASDRTPVEFMKACPKLKLLQFLSAGYDNLDVGGVQELGIKVATNGGANSISVAEHAITLMLAVLHRIRPQWESVRAGKWDDDWVGQGAYDLTGRTVGILGLGRIGKNVARRLRGWDVKTIYHDLLMFPEDLERELKVQRARRDDLFHTSDVITLHVPHTPVSYHLIDQYALSLMKPTAVLINTSRGPVVDEQALVRALREKRIAGAGLDVFEKESPPDFDNPLFHMDNVIYTPHFGTAAAEVLPRGLKHAYGNMLRVLRGEEPLSRVA